jgi:hypothetical protein
MTPEEKAKALVTLQSVRQQIDLLHAEAFTAFVEAVHNFSLMLKPLVQNQEVLAYKLIEIEQLLRNEVME